MVTDCGDLSQANLQIQVARLLNKWAPELALGLPVQPNNATCSKPFSSRWAPSPIANRKRSAIAVNCRKPFRNTAWTIGSTNERQLSDGNRCATNAGSMRTTSGVSGGDLIDNACCLDLNFLETVSSLEGSHRQSPIARVHRSR